MSEEAPIPRGVPKGMRSVALLLALVVSGCGDPRPSGGGDAGPAMDDGGAPTRDAGPGGLDAMVGDDAGTAPVDAGTATDAGADDPNVLIWRLDGVEVARSTGAEAGADYLFLPHWGRNVQAYWTSPPAPGTHGCADMTATGLRVGLLTVDNSWANLDALPERWKNLNITSCAFTPDTYTVTLTLDATSGRYRGTLHIEVVGAAERAGETLTVDGTFDIAY